MQTVLESKNKLVTYSFTLVNGGAYYIDIYVGDRCKLTKVAKDYDTLQDMLKILIKQLNYINN